MASKIADRYNRPTIIVSFDEDLGKGSCRSIEKFHILDALAECKDYLEDFGGHRYAAGLTISKKYFDDFKESINRIALGILQPEDYLPGLDIDACIDFGDLSQDLISQINSLAPFGEGNPRPIFSTKRLMLKSKPIKLGRDTLKLWVSDGRFTYQAIGFGMSKYYDLVENSDTIDLAYSVSFDKWQGENNIQLEIKDIKPQMSTD